MIVLGIDPGPEKSAFVWWDTDDRKIFDMEWSDNERLVKGARTWSIATAIETVEARGQTYGNDLLWTAIWIGRFFQRFKEPGKIPFLITHNQVRSYLCGTRNSTNAQVHAALLSELGFLNRKEAVGVKKAPGPLYGIKSHCWDALAVAITWLGMQGLKEPKGRT